MLVDGVYREVGRSGGLAGVDEPWTVAIDVDALAPEGDRGAGQIVGGSLADPSGPPRETAA